MIETTEITRSPDPIMGDLSLIDSLIILYKDTRTYAYIIYIHTYIHRPCAFWEKGHYVDI